jgi:CO/xanthine dehydrogenase FAD-binding subunit
VADVQWYFPRELSEVPALLAREGVIPHGGGTGILRGGMSQVRGLVDLGRLGLDRIHRNGDAVTVGAAASFAAVAEAAGGWDPAHVLARSLGSAATTPLRNRITVGGSIALFPYWSDLMGPLVALEAQLHLVGVGEGSGAGGSAADTSDVRKPAERWVPVTEYVARRELREGSLITEVRWQERGAAGEYRRWGRTHTDRPAFSLTVLATRSGGDSGTFEDVRAVLIGCKGRYRRLTETEEAAAAGKNPASAAALAEIDIPSRMGFGGQDLCHCARVELERALAALGGARPVVAARGVRG